MINVMELLRSGETLTDGTNTLYHFNGISEKMELRDKRWHETHWIEFDPIDHVKFFKLALGNMLKVLK